MNRFVSVALVTVAAWAVAAGSSRADAFGLFYSKGCCNSCSFCVRPYNAFSPVACGVADVGCCGGGGGGCGQAGYPWMLPGLGYKPDLYSDNGCSAFGTCGARIAYSGVPAGNKGWERFGFPCGGGACAGGPLMAPQPPLGHMPPPGPVARPVNTCGTWFPAPYQPGFCAYYPAPVPYALPAALPAPTPAMQPVSYQQPYPYGFGPMPAWNAVNYWNAGQ